MRPISMISGVALVLLPVYSASPVWGQADPEQQRQTQALMLIRETARDICYDIQQSGQETDFQMKGEIQAKVSGIAARIANLGVGATAEVQDSQYQGMVRDQVADVIRRSIDCKKDVFDKLCKTMLRGCATFQQTRQGPPVSTPIPTQGLLYETGIDKGEFEKWSLTPGWGRLAGMLINNGTRGDKDFFPALAAYGPASADYAVEADIRVVKESDRLGDSFGVVVRVNGEEGYAVGVASRGGPTRICYLSAWKGVGFVGGGNSIRDNSRCRPAGQTFSPDEKLHTYRVEVRRNTIRLLIDDNVMTEATDNMFTSGSGTGLWSSHYQLEVPGFRIFALR